MEVISNNYMPGDSRLVQQLVYELKSQGIFDQFRKECISDVDTKPAYQNLRQRVEGSVSSFLNQQTWRPDMNKNQVREQLRKNIYESGFLETGVERIVDQVVNPKINTIFLPQVEDVVYRYLGVEKPMRQEVRKELKIDVSDLLPTDLEAVSPESDHTKDDSSNLNDSVNLDSKLEEDESPPFEPLDCQQNETHHEENSGDSHLSGFSGLQSHDSNPPHETKMSQVESLNQDSQVSRNSSESHLSIITSEDNTKMEVCEDSDSKCIKSSDAELKSENSSEIPAVVDKNSVEVAKVEVAKVEEEVEVAKVVEKMEVDKKEEKPLDEKVESKREEIKVVEKKTEDKKREDKKYNKKSDDKKSRSSDKHSSKDRKDEKREDKHKKSSSSRDKDKSSSRHTSSSSKDKERKEKERKESKSSSSSSKEKEKSEKDKEKLDKEKSSKEKDKSEKDKDKNKSSSSSNSSSKHSSKDKVSTSKKESSSRDKDKQRSSSSSTSKDNKSKSSHGDSKSSHGDAKCSHGDAKSSHGDSKSSHGDSKSSHGDSKSKSSSTDKHKKDDRSSHNGKHSSSIKKDKDKKRDSKKESKDDHYSSKEKKNDRRSTDRDSNDGQSSRQSQSNSFPATTSSRTQKSSQESSNSNSGSGSGDSGNSDQIEHKTVKSPLKLPQTLENKEAAGSDVQTLKYIKPRFASNFQEARILMKVRRQLAKLERQNQLSLAQIEVPVEAPIVNGLSYPEKENDKVDKVDIVAAPKPKSPEQKPVVTSPKDFTPILQSTELSKESWEALEARLAQEMSLVNYNSYESYDDYDYNSYNAIIISPRKNKITEVKHAAVEEKIEKTVKAKTGRLDKEKEKTSQPLPEPVKNLVPDKEKTPEPPQTPRKKSTEAKDNVESERKLVIHLQREEKVEHWETTVQSLPQSPVKSDCVVEECTERKKPDVEPVTVSTAVELPPKAEAEPEKTCDADDCCRYLEKPSASSERNLQFLRSYIAKLERDVEHSLKTSQNNFLSAKRGRKRKLEENVDVKNNNKAHFEKTTETKKRRRSLAPNPPNSVANKEKLCNSTDISPNDSFSLPLSPAESDKSNDKKEEESPKAAKQQRTLGRATTRSQRYSSDDLYKPRPMFSTRRSRGAKNPE